MAKLHPKEALQPSLHVDCSENIWAFTTNCATKCFNAHIPGILKASAIALIATTVAKCYRKLTVASRTPVNPVDRAVSLIAYSRLVLLGDLELSVVKVVKNWKHAKVAIYIVESILTNMTGELALLSMQGSLSTAVSRDLTRLVI